MGSVTSANDPLTAPCSAQLALALIVLRSKPTNLSTADYLERLRAKIRDGRQQEQHRRLDSTAFWKQAYEDSEAVQAKLHDKIYELEQRLNSSATECHSTVAAIAAVGGKRQRGPEKMAKANSQSKRRAIHATGLDGFNIATKPGSKAAMDEEADRVQKVPTTFTRRFCELRQSMRSRKSADVSQIARSIHLLCSSAGAMLHDAVETAFPTRGKRLVPSSHLLQEREAVVHIIQILGQCYSSILDALDKIAAKATEVRLRGVVMHDMVRLFQHVLGQLHALCSQKAGDLLGHEQSAKGSRSRRAVKQQNTATACDPDQISRQLANFLAQTVVVLDLSKSSHHDLFEGLVCAFLDHLGSSLSLVVFGDNSPVSPRDGDTSGLLDPQGLQHTDRTAIGASLKAALLEAPYLIYILDRIMTVVDSRQSLMSSRSGPLFALRKDATISNNEFGRRIKQKLQNTLLRGVFGDDDLTFCDALQRAPPVELGEEIPGSDERSRGTPEWFTGEAWRILGWDILASTVP